MSRKIKLVSIDGDGSLFAYTNIGSATHSSWDAVGHAYGLREIWDRRAKEFAATPGRDSDWAWADAADLRGRRVSDAHATIYPIPYSPGAAEFLRASKGRLVRGLLSACLDVVGRKAAEEMELDFCHCNGLHVEDGAFTGGLDYSVPVWDKHLLIPQLCQQFNVKPAEICHVGDHENDIACFKEAGLAVAFNPKRPSVAQAARHVIADFRELHAILELTAS